MATRRGEGVYSEPVSSKLFEKLDAETRALHDSWDSITRIVVLVAMLAALIWGACTALRLCVHWMLTMVLSRAQQPGWVGMATLAGFIIVGAGIRGLLVRRASWSKAAGDGMDTALDNYHAHADKEDTESRYDEPAFGLAAKKFVATVLTLGTGSSGGLEGPVVLIAECLSAGFSRVFAVRSQYELRTYQLAGISAAISALLGAPFAAALFATEMAHGERFEYRKLAYCLWAGVIAYWLNTSVRGTYEPLFVSPDHSPVYSIPELGGATLVAVVISMPVALGFGRAMLYLQQLFEGRVRRSWHAVTSAVVIAVIALALSYTLAIDPVHVLGVGEETVNGILDGTTELSAWWMLLAVVLGKILTTGLTNVGGGSAGLLVPSMYLGGASGALIARLVNLTGWTHLDPALFAVVGIGSSLVAVVGVPLAAIALIFEVFGKSFGPPAILACGVTYLLTLKLKIYQRPASVAAPAEPAEESAPSPRPMHLVD